MQRRIIGTCPIVEPVPQRNRERQYCFLTYCLRWFVKGFVMRIEIQMSLVFLFAWLSHIKYWCCLDFVVVLSRHTKEPHRVINISLLDQKSTTISIRLLFNKTCKYILYNFRMNVCIYLNIMLDTYSNLNIISDNFLYDFSLVFIISFNHTKLNI